MNITLSDLKDFCDNKDIIIIDIRYSPYSKMRIFWNKDYLSGVFKDKYIHIKELGNMNYKGKEIKINDLDTGLSKIKSFISKDVILLCSCKDYNKCHRKIISEEISKKFSVNSQEIDML